MPMVRVAGGWADEGCDLRSLGWDNLLADPRAVAAYDVEGSLLVVNDPMLELLRWSIADFEQRGWLSCLYPDVEEQRITLHNGRELNRRGRVPLRHTRSARRGDGSTVLLDLLSAPLELPDGRRGIFTTIADATERGTPLAMGRGQRELVEDAPDILARVDLRSNQVLFLSRAVERILGYTPAEMCADPALFRGRLLPASQAALEAALVEVVRGVPQWVILDHRRKDGEIATLHQALYPLRDASGRVVVVEGVARDITAVRALERQLQQTVEELRARNAELSSLDRLKSQLLANVSHELRTPLVTIRGYNELMLRGSLGPVTDRQRRALDISAGSIERLVDLIETLLDFARREEGRLALRRLPIDARQAFREAADAAAPRLRDKGLGLSVELGARPLEVDGDRPRLVQLLAALLSNAEKFCPAPGEVRVTAGLEGGAVVLRVSDTGIGIPEAARAKVFERFYQVDASATRRVGGAGLGLALAREIATLHEGSIEVESEEGRGSTFTVRLPLRPAADSPRDDERPVLLLGAPPAPGESLRARLEAEGLTVLEAGSGVEVIRRARRHRPDAVVLALGADLLDTIATLHHDPETMRIPVIAMVEAERREAALPIADYVVSPGEAPRLADAVRRLLGRDHPAVTDRPLRVLVVDDEPEIVDFTRFVLEREGYQVSVATAGDAAIAEAGRVGAPCDLVLLDIALEGLDGIELCRRLKTAPATAAVPVLMVTAMSGDDVRRSAIEAGADGLITKPFGVEDFLRQVRLHLRSDPAGSRPPGGLTPGQSA